MAKSHTACWFIVLALAVTACADGISPVPGGGDATVRPAFARADVSTALQAGYIQTPAGLYHPSCVHEIPAGARVNRRLDVVTRRDGSRYTLPLCTHLPIPANRGRERGAVVAPIANGWVEEAETSNYPSYGQINANWTVPAAPPAAYSSGQVYYTFPGLENSTYIIQPVLQYGNNGAYGGNYWTLTSWHCNTGSNCVHSTPASATSGDVIQGQVTASNCSGGACAWYITTHDLTRGGFTALSINDTFDYSIAVGGAVEVYGLTSCNSFPPNGVFYNSISVYNASMQQVTPSWGNYVNTTGCQFNVTSTATTVNLYHNAVATSLTGASRASAGNTCTYTAAVSGGTAPYTYAWSWTTSGGGSVGGYSQSPGTFLLAMQSSGGTAYLTVGVTDANGNGGDATKTVNISPMNGYCEL